MRRPSFVLAALAGGLTGLALLAILYLGQQLAHLPFVPFDVFDWLARVLPGGVITAGIDSMVRLIQLTHIGPISGSAKRLEQLTGILLILAGCVAMGLVIAWLLRRRPAWSGRQVGAIAGLVASALVLAIEYSPAERASAGASAWTLLWLPLVITSWGALLGWLIERLSLAPSAAPEAGQPAVTRRDLLVRLAGGSLGVALAAWGLGSAAAATRAQTGAGQALSQLGVGQAGTGATPPALLPGAGASLATAGPATPAAAAASAAGASTPSAAPAAAPSTPAPIATANPAQLRERVPAAPGTRPEITANENFYRIDIDTVPPVINGSDWQLQVRGLFDRPRALKLEDLAAFPAITQPITQSCISNPIGGDLISATNYTGARLRDVLQSLGLRREAGALNITSADGFYESVDMNDIMDPRTLLVYGMNGTTLPIEHGYPLRIYRPNRYGMKQPKWIIALEAAPALGAGYWVDRGWSAEARPQVISIIDTVAKDQPQNGRVPIGGIAWAGDRGIQKVEVQIDNGPWTEAVLRTPTLSPLTWVQWRYDWAAAPGTHTISVRAVDGTGQMQIGAPSDTYPNGATGYHSVRVKI